MVSRKNRPRRGRMPGRPAAIPKYRFVVSACLAGIDCTFKGGNNLSKKVRKLFEDGAALAACPEVAGGLGIPRERSEICGGGGPEVLKKRAGVFSLSGKDKTLFYLRGAAAVTRLVKRLGIKEAILKSDSPSCGQGRIYDGTFSGRFRPSDGVFAAMLKQSGVRVYGENSGKYE